MKSETFNSYKKYREHVENAASQWFSRKGKRCHHRSPYILSRHEDWKYNIILDDVYPLVVPIRPRHTYIHHGLSSQALCFNLFGSLKLKDDIDVLKPLFVAHGIISPDAKMTGKFEYEEPSVLGESHKEQPTSWDFAIGTVSADGTSMKTPHILIEVKFVEKDLGACSVFERGDCGGLNPLGRLDSCYLVQSKKRGYWEVFEKLGIDDTEPFKGAICPLTIYYQFFREAAFAASMNARMVYILDDRNPALMGGQQGKGLIPALIEMLPERVSNNIAIIPISDVISVIQSSGRHDGWIEEFALKYGFTGMD